MTQAVIEPNSNRSVTTAAEPTPACVSRRWHDIGQLVCALGDVPASRILLDPPPGTATEADMISKVEHDDTLVELVHGALVEKPVGGWEDAYSVEIGRLLGNHVSQLKLGWMNGSQSMKRMSGGNVRQPDVAFTSIKRLSAKEFRGTKINSVAPDLAIEVLSEGNTRGEMELKRIEYFASGTSLVWEVDPPAQTFAIYTSPDAYDVLLMRSDTLTGGAVLPEFRLELEVFWSCFDVDE